MIFPSQDKIAQKLQVQKDAFRARYTPENNEKIAFKRLKIACERRNLRDIREALVTWSMHYTSTHAALTVEDILQEPELSSLHPDVDKIQSRLFNERGESKEETQFIPEDFLKTASQLRRLKLRKDKILRSEQRFALPPLYKTI